jgi:parallel beta-helix repeat protein
MTSSTWYGLYYDAVSQSITVISVNNLSPGPPPINNPSPTTIVVPDDYLTIQSAVNAASPGDTVYVKAGTYRENVQVKKALSIVGEGPQGTVIDGGNVRDVISVLADHVSITGFTICDDQHVSKGGWDYADIMLSASSCTISGNVLTDSFAGVDISGSAADNSITRNNITANSAGLLLFESPHNNNITENIINNNAIGVDLNVIGSSAYDNAFYHNNFLDNTLQVVSGGQTSVWDNGYPSGGNYWSHYRGTDLFNGPNQNQTGSDGIGDSPYVIDANNIDRYPLMGPYLSLYSSAAEALISCISNSTISGFQLTGTTISFDVSGEPGTTGFCTLTIPHSTLLPPYTIEIGGNPTSYAIIYEDTTESVIFFTYQHSTHEVIVTGVPALIHDVAITNVKSSKTVVCQGYGLNVTVTAADWGRCSETFQVTVYANTSSVASQNITLSSGDSANVTFTCDTAGLALGKYTISAYAWPVPGETNTANNYLTDGWIFVSMPGDVTGTTPFIPDGKVDGRDITAVALCFGSKVGDPRYNPNCDILNRGEIDGRDITIVAEHFGEHSP